MPDDNQYVEVATGVTNTTPNSNVDVFLSLDGPPICTNMSDSEFRHSVMKLRDEAVILVSQRLNELAQWSHQDQQRVADWFGKNDSVVRNRLISGLTALNQVMQGLGPKNFLRASADLDRHLGCLPNLKNVQNEIAHVCAPNTATHTICIRENFCTMNERDMFADSRLSTIIHEVTHFYDTFSAKDNMYTVSSYLAIWGQKNPEMAIDNADSIAGYVVYGEDQHQ